MERWFVRRGVPHLIDQYAAATDIWTRALPVLVIAYVVGGFRALDIHAWSLGKNLVASAIVVVVLGIYSFTNNWGGLILVPLLAAIGMLLILFAPGVMPNTKLPGSRGSLLLVTGGAAAVLWAISALSWLGWIFGHLATLDTLLYLVGLVAALAMGWFGWQAFQAEGGKFEVGAPKG